MIPSTPSRTRAAAIAVGAALAWGLAAGPVSAQSRSPDRFSFVVVGHMRGNSDAELYPRIGELLDRIRTLKPDLLFLTGDLIWGSIPAELADRAAVIAQWDALDAKLDGLGIPVYRVPGNHDIHDPTTRDVFFERYGAYPKVVERGNARFILLNSTFTPTGDAPVPAYLKLGKTIRLDSSQVRFLSTELAKHAGGPNFVLMHHVLWFDPAAPWWTEVHPTLTGHGVRAVFSGDLGPTMYTHLRRDGVEYFRSIVNADVDNSLAGDPAARGKIIPSLQFETFLYVTVDGPTVDYQVVPIGTLTSAAFSPARWHDAFGTEAAPGRYYDPATFRPDSARAAGGSAARSPSLLERFWEAFGSPRRLAALAGLAGIAFAGGVVLGRAGRRKTTPA